MPHAPAAALLPPHAHSHTDAHTHATMWFLYTRPPLLSCHWCCAGVESVLCRSIIKPCPAAAPPADDGSVPPEAGEAVEADEDAEDLEAAAAAAAAASSSSDSSLGAAGSQEASQEGETKYIENMTVEVGKDGKFEL